MVADGDDAGRLFVALARLNRMMRRDAPAELGHGAVTALATIVRDGPLRLGDLAVREGVRAPTMTRIVAHLESEGHVARDTDPADGRAFLVRATPSGRELVRGASSARADLLRARMGHLSRAERDALTTAIPILEALATDPAPPAHQPAGIRAPSTR